MSRWFRHYAGMMRDEKLVRVAIKSKQSIERVLWVWGAVLESAAEIDDNGKYDLDPAEVAYFLRADEDDVVGILSGLAQQGHISEGAVVRWGDRQFTSDKSAERQRRYRERQKTGADRVQEHGNEVGGGTGNAPVATPSRHGDVTVTAQETETETETEELEAKASSGSGDPEALKPEHFVEAWNDLADRLAKPKVRDITPERRVRLKARIAGYSLDDFRTVLGNVERSPFLRGDRQWQGCTFDWITKKANFQKILEGNYNG